MPQDTADLTGAISALAAALKSMQERLLGLDTQVTSIRQQKRCRLDGRVADLLPDLSSATIGRLRREAPAIGSDPKVQTIFAQNKKIFWLFKPAGYDDSLKLLQFRLKHYLEMHGYTADNDQILQRLETEKGAISEQYTQVTAMLDLLQRVFRQGPDTVLAPEAVATINGLAQRGRRPSSGKPRQRLASTDVQPNRSTLACQDSDDGTDLLLWALTDIPSSFRTLMLDALAPPHSMDSLRPSAPHGGGGDFAGAGATSSFEAPLASAASFENPIATDDRLGAFS